MRVSTAEQSAPIHEVMVSRAAATIPLVSSCHFDEVVAQEAPALLIEALQGFAVGAAQSRVVRRL